jgi:tetratricopeptide (TPR) repeat protein
MKYFILLFSIFLLSLQSCTTSKALAKKALKLEEASQYASAADIYYLSAKKDNANIDALTGLKRTGDRVLNDYLKDFSKDKLNENYKKATYTYLDAEKYVAKIKIVGVELEIPEFTQEDFKIVKKLHLNKEYEEGLKLIESENFTEAEQRFNEVYKFDKNYKDIKELRNIAFLEPFYRKAETYKNNKEYRKAYEAYQKILNRLPNYKDSKDNSEYVLRAGRVNIVLLSPKKGMKIKFASYTDNIKTYTINAIIKKKDPFIKIVDRENLESILTEQELAVSGLVAEDGSMEVGALSGAKYALSIKVTNYLVEDKPITQVRKNGFEKYSEKYFNKTTQKNEYRTKYKPVRYSRSYGSRQVNFTVHVKLISLSSGEILSSEIVEDNSKSVVNFLSYDGNIKNLYPSKDGKVNTSYSAHNNLVELSKGKRTLESKNKLTQDLYKSISQTIARMTIKQFSN